jgi:hypothetical protein
LRQIQFLLLDIHVRDHIVTLWEQLVSILGQHKPALWTIGL